MGASPRAAWLAVAWVALSAVAGCGTGATTSPPPPASEAALPGPTDVVRSPAVRPSMPAQPTCTATIAATGLYEAAISGEVIGAPRRNGFGAGIDIDLFFDATSKGRTYPMLLSIWDPDSSTGPKPTSILFGPRDGSSPLGDSGTAADMGTAAIADDGSTASFDVRLRLGSILDGSIECPAVDSRSAHTD